MTEFAEFLYHLPKVSKVSLIGVESLNLATQGFEIFAPIRWFNNGEEHQNIGPPLQMMDMGFFNEVFWTFHVNFIMPLLYFS